VVGLALGAGAVFGVNALTGVVAAPKQSPASWQQLEVPFEPGEFPSASVWLGDGEYLVFGVGANTDQAYRFSLADMSWRQVADMPAPYKAGADNPVDSQLAVLHDGSVWVALVDSFADEGVGDMSQIVRYDIAADAWETVRDCASIPGNFVDLAATPDAVAVFKCEGYDTETFDYLFDGQWRQAAIDVDQPAGTGVGNVLFFAVEEEDDNTYYEAFDPTTGKWVGEEPDRNWGGELTHFHEDLPGHGQGANANTTTASSIPVVDVSQTLLKTLDPASLEPKDTALVWDATGVGDALMIVQQDDPQSEYIYSAIDLDSGHAWRLPAMDGLDKAPVPGTFNGTGYALHGQDGKWWLATFG
jgi:hypothetical protein